MRLVSKIILYFNLINLILNFIQKQGSITLSIHYKILVKVADICFQQLGWHPTGGITDYTL